MIGHYKGSFDNIKKAIQHEAKELPTKKGNTKHIKHSRGSVEGSSKNTDLSLFGTSLEQKHHRLQHIYIYIYLSIIYPSIYPSIHSFLFMQTNNDGRDMPPSHPTPPPSHRPAVNTRGTPRIRAPEGHSFGVHADALLPRQRCKHFALLHLGRFSSVSSRWRELQ